jgi:phospholipid-binding lipoprotein MlaA
MYFCLVLVGGFAASAAFANDTGMVYFASGMTSADADAAGKAAEETIALEKSPEAKKEEPGNDNGGSAFGELQDPFAEETPQYPPIKDPFEGFNRSMYKLNDTIYDYFLEPVSRTYKQVVPEDARLGVKNLFDNASSPVNLVSSIFQGDVDKVVRVLGRFVLNTVVGIGGLFDVAEYYEIEPVSEDFEQALGHYNVPAGPYLVLPFFGPASGRNVAGRVVDSFLSPTVWFSPTFIVGAGISLGDTVNGTSFKLDDIDALEKDAVDPYISQRDFFHQYREGKIRK